MAKQLLGKEVVAALNERIIAKAEALKANGVTPTLGIVRVGENESDLSYCFCVGLMFAFNSAFFHTSGKSC